MKRYLILIPLLIFLLSSCKDDIGNNGVDNSGETGLVTIYGKVISPDNEPVFNAVVTMDGMTTLTNDKGYFSFGTVEIPLRQTYLKVESEGAFPSGRMIITESGDTEFYTIKLLSKISAGSVASGQGGEVTLGTDGAKVVLQANGFVDEDGNSYNGNVNVFYNQIRTDDPEFTTILPSGLEAINTEGESGVLASFGMLAIELRDDAGNELNIGNGKTAELTFPIAADILGNAPSTIPLWYLNEETGLWEEDGEAILEGSNYVGNVSHFTFWNCDDFFNGVPIIIIINDENGDPIPHHGVVAQVLSNGMTSSSYTDINGRIFSYFPSDELIHIVSTTSFNCYVNGLSFEADIGPFSFSDVVPQNIIVDEILPRVNISGNINSDCATNANSWLMVVKNPSDDCTWEFILDQSTFNVDVPGMENTEYTLNIYDFQNTLKSSTIDITGSTDVGTIDVCEDSEEYLIFEGESESFSFSPFVFYFDEYDDGDVVGYDLKGAPGSSLFELHIRYTDADNIATSSAVTYFSHNDGMDYDIWCDSENTDVLLQPCNENLFLVETDMQGGHLKGVVNGFLTNWATNQAEPYSLQFRLRVE